MDCRVKPGNDDRRGHGLKLSEELRTTALVLAEHDNSHLNEATAKTVAAAQKLGGVSLVVLPFLLDYDMPLPISNEEMTAQIKITTVSKMQA